ncbi:MAG TPA: host attachment protein [Roseateles sp.]
MKTTWIVVADEAIARILEQPAGGSELLPVENLTDPDAHIREAGMRHGPYGRRGDGATVSAADSERHQHAQLFAARVAERLAEALRQGVYQTLHLIAAPRMLGYLRKALPPSVAAAVASEQDKDLVQASPAELAQRLAQARP